MGIALITNNILSDSGTAVSGLVPTSRTISTTSPLTGGGDLSADRTIAIPAATSTISGYLTNVDWVTFNSKQNALTNPVTGTGTTNYLPKFTGASTIGNSAITDDGTTVTLVSRALSGTSATFSNDVSIIEAGNALLRIQASTTTTPVADIELMRGTNTTWGADAYGDYRLRSNGGDLLIQYGDTGVTNTRLTIASTGAATFSSSVTAGGSITIGTGGNYSTGSIYSDGQWGMIFRAKQASPTLAEYRWANSADSELMRISPSGGLQIGTTPDSGYKLDVAGTGRFSGNLYLGSLTNEQLMISGTGSRGIGVSTITSGDPYVRLYDNTTIKADIWWGRSGNYMGVNSLGAGSITAINPNGGNVGIGTTSPTQLLTLGGTATVQMTLRSSTNTGASEIYFGDSDAVYRGYIGYQHNGDYFTFNTAASEKMRITSGGNVLINATTSSYGSASGYNLGVKGISSQAFISIARSTQALDSQGLVMGIDTSEGSIYVRDNLPFTIYTNNTFVARFGANGNVLIGTSTDAGQKLQVSGGSLFNGTIRMNNNAGGMDLNRGTTSDYVGVSYKTTDVYKWFAGMRENTATSNYVIYNYTNPADVLTLNVSNNTATFISSVSATSFFETSDKTVKTLIQDNVLIKGIEKVTAKTYIKNNKEEIGYFAQDLQGVLDSSINVGEKGLLSLSYTQVHTAKIAVAESEIDKLKKRVAELEQQLNLN